MFEDLVKITNAKVLFGEDNGKSYAISTDTRTISDKNVYLPLKGEKFDGHNFIEKAIESGAKGYFTSDEKLKIASAEYALLVEDTKVAYLQCARAYKRSIKPITVAVTGSSGKTTTKEMMAFVFAQKFKTHKSELNHNNEIGLAQTLLSMPADTQVLIVEMGMRGIGEIEFLSEFAEPDIGVISNVGPAHIGRLGSLDNISIAKNEISKYLSKEGILIALGSEIVKKYNNYEGETKYFSLNSPDLKILSQTQQGSEFKYGNYKYKLNVEGDYNIQNALAVIEAAKYAGIEPEKIDAGLQLYRPIEKRWEVEKIHDFKVINDSYNANPDSVKAALKTFLGLSSGDLLVVLGGMGELGDESSKYHKEIGEFLNKFNNFRLITVGDLAKIIGSEANCQSVHFNSNDGVASYIKNNVKPLTTILFKASRTYEFEKIIEELKNI